jgi:hypothetical protein
MDGHRVHPREEISAKRFRETAKPDLFVSLISQKLRNGVVIFAWLEVILCSGIDFVLGISPRPEAFTKSCEYRLYERLIWMIGKE